MILLRPDCLVFKMSDGESIPCSAEMVTVELIGDAAKLLDEGVVENAAAAVLHYFKSELGRVSVSVAEFSLALERVLRGLGLSVVTTEEPQADPEMVEADLSQLASESGKAELLFFPRLRDEIRGGLHRSPQLLRFRGLRGCVKHLTGAKRWSSRCQMLNDQIVEYLRTCFQTHHSDSRCCLIVE